MKLVSLFLKSLLLSLLLLQVNVHASQWTALGSSLYTLCTHTPVMLITGICTWLFGGISWLDAKTTTSTPQKSPHKMLCVADTCSLSNALWSLESELDTNLDLASPDRSVRVQKHIEWQAASNQEEQKLFLEKYYDTTVLHYLGKDFSNSICVKTAAPARLKRTLFEAKGEKQYQSIDPVTHALSFNAHRTVQTEWTQPCTISSITQDNHTYNAVIINRNCQLFNTTSHRHPIVQIKMANDDILGITHAGDFNPHTALELSEYIDALYDSKIEGSCIKACATLPMIALKHEEDITWLAGITLREYTVTQAQQKTSFTLDQTAVQRNGIYVPLERDTQETERQSVLIDDTCLVWINRKGVRHPIFAAYIPTGYWQKNA